ncbi:MAG: hypothetical protein FWD72_02820 [Eggerthellaceae bacterium]|nr:hypothetical protein [Eggerthellaceae bacterium]
MKKAVTLWAALMVAGVFCAGCVYVSFQQQARLGADVPAAMAAQQAAYELGLGASPQEALPAQTDMAETITPFVMVYDNNKKLVAASTDMGGFSYPQGCLDQIDSSNGGDNRVTWQPESGLRFATVGIKVESGYVVGAYSLSESENATDRFSNTLLMGCALYAVGCAVLALLYSLIAKRFRKK